MAGVRGRGRVMSAPGPHSETLPTDPRRVKAFASFFKNYMSVSSLIVAALPVPVTAFGALPTFADHKAPLATYTSLFCFLALGFIFYLRHSLARWMFPQPVAQAGSGLGGSEEAAGRHAEATRAARLQAIRATGIGILPLLLILASAYLVYRYHSELGQAVADMARQMATPKGDPKTVCADLSPGQMMVLCNVLSPKEILARSYPGIQQLGATLMPLYIGMFVCAEAAFILMATREYVQDLLLLSDIEVIRGRRVAEA